MDDNWQAWIKDIEDDVGDDWATVRNLNIQRIKDLEKGTTQPEYAFAVHFRLHGELERLKFANAIDRFVFPDGKTFAEKYHTPVFKWVDERELPLRPTFPEKIELADSYQRGRPEFKDVKSALLEGTSNSVSHTVAVHGAGGYGKTAIAEEICLDPEIRKVFPGGIYWLEFGIIERGGGTSDPRFISEEEAVSQMLIAQYSESNESERSIGSVQEFCSQLPENDDKVLIIADGLWIESQYRWMKGVPAHITVLFTTRNKRLLGSTSVRVRGLSTEAAQSLVSHGVKKLSIAETKRLQSICRRFNGWPLLLAMANRKFKYLQRENFSVDKIFERFEVFLESGHIDGWDDPKLTVIGYQEKQRTLVRYSIESSINAVLSFEQRTLLLSLAVFEESEHFNSFFISEYWRKIFLLEKFDVTFSDLWVLETLDLMNDFCFFKEYEPETGLFSFYDEIFLHIISLCPTKKWSAYSKMHDAIMKNETVPQAFLDLLAKIYEVERSLEGD
nr:NB-ARC domain-containing protein [Notoacmeibacter marinus]